MTVYFTDITDVIDELTNVRNIANMEITSNTQVNSTCVNFTYSKELADIRHMIDKVANM